MAERRMFAKTITNSDSFLEMPTSSQALYFHLSMNADDDGFINRPKAIMRMVGAKEDDLKVLFAKSFIIPFDSGIVVIKHWKINNYIQKDRYKPTEYLEEKSTLTEKENGAYTLLENACIQNGYILDTQDRLGKDRLGKDSQEEIKEHKVPLSELDKALKDFETMRNKIKKPLTANAKNRLLMKLKKICGDDESLQIEVLNQSVDHCWQDVYPLKAEERARSIEEQPMMGREV